MLSPWSNPAYRQMMKRADFILATPSTYRSFIHDVGCSWDQLIQPIGAPLHPRYFHPDVSPLDINAYLDSKLAMLPEAYAQGLYHNLKQKSFDPTLPTIGIYGKIGITKGTFDLLKALAVLKRKGLRFNLLALTQGDEGLLARFSHTLDHLDLRDNTWLLPFMAHWMVPQFLKRCTAVCFLERDFPIPTHMPQVASECLAVGTCLVLSHEIADKQFYRNKLVHGHNVFLTNPKDTLDLARSLAGIICDPIQAKEVGAAGHREVHQTFRTWDAYCRQLDQQIQEMSNILEERKSEMSMLEFQSCLARLYTDNHFRRSFFRNPAEAMSNYVLDDEEQQVIARIEKKALGVYAASLREKRLDQYRKNFSLSFRYIDSEHLHRLSHRYCDLYPVDPGADRITDLERYYRFCQQYLAQDDIYASWAADLLAYEWAFIELRYRRSSLDSFLRINTVIKADDFDAGKVEEYRFSLAEDTTVKSFGFHVLDLLKTLATGETLEDLPALRQPFFMVFQRKRESFIPEYYEINFDTFAFLSELCHTTLAEAVAAFKDRHGMSVERSDALDLLKELIAARVVQAQRMNP